VAFTQLQASLAIHCLQAAKTTQFLPNNCPTYCGLLGAGFLSYLK